MTFEEFVAARLPALLRYATVLAADPHDADDVVQEVLLRVQQRWSRISDLDAPEAYVRRMIANELISVRRRFAARLRREQVTAPQPVPDRSDEVAGNDALVRLIRTLPPRQRVVVALRYVEDLSDVEIATMLGISLGTVRSQAARALATLRRALTPTSPHTLEI
ncbi:SigE family RNA polymerase sigma factor [Dactylosporangium sp. NPDC051485]|uniref:SigE family RNA polymerase sigma factor n=1 Tax=Dactylosporangium sp. NPDC051485 TaxID=3154846 RepID=UPI00342A52DE